MSAASVEGPMTPDGPMAQSGARWCGQHGRWECAAAKPDHHATAIRGLAYCKNCCGRPLALAKSLGEANLLTWSTAAASPDLAPLDPGRVVLEQLRVAVMRSDLYGELLRWQIEAEDESGLIGKTYAASATGARVETGEAVRALAKLEAEWRDRVVRFAKAAHDMGIAERHVELEQERAGLVTAAFRAALAVLELLPADRDLAVRTFLSSLGAGDVVVGEVTA